ncbi:MAG: hypothetical protein WAO19_13245 [Candidatus Kryptoniota bacterium]
MFKRFESSFDSVDRDFNNGLMFVRQVEILDRHGPNGDIAQKKFSKIPASPRYGTLYISRPFGSNQVLLILSSVSPVQTIILLLDSVPSARLVYDSFQDSLQYDGYGPLGTVIKVAEGQNATYYLFEGVMQEEWQTKFFPRKQRVFILNLRKKPPIQLFLGN